VKLVTDYCWRLITGCDVCVISTCDTERRIVNYCIYAESDFDMWAMGMHSDTGHLSAGPPLPLSRCLRFNGRFSR